MAILIDKAKPLSLSLSPMKHEKPFKTGQKLYEFTTTGTLKQLTKQ